MPGFFAAAIKMLQAHPTAGLFSGDAVLVDGQSGRSLGARPPVRPRLSSGFIGPSEVAGLLQRNDNFVVTGAAVFRRDAVVSAGGFDEQLSSFADGYLVRKIALTFGFCYAPTTVLTWCVFPDSVSRTTSTQPDRARHILEKIEDAAGNRSRLSAMVSARVPPPLAFCDVAPCRSGRSGQSRHAAGNGRAECGGSRRAELSFEHIRPEQRTRADFGLALVAVSAVLADRSGNNGTGEILGRGFSKAVQRMTKKPRGRCLIGFVQNDTRTDRGAFARPGFGDVVTSKAPARQMARG